MDQNSIFEEPIGPPTSDEKTMAVLSHVLTIAVGFIAPLIIYLIKKDESKFISDQAKESLNFQITLTLACIVLAITIIGILLIWPLLIVALVFIIIASVRSGEGKRYRYPFNIRFIK
ncbi:MAG: DUF4870 domain-containing protein [Chitinophagaceae bacterium]|nr:DUF4870 domain-containing protein [Chitinophagaceae bacterium]MCW5925529.1 DUF4870 domain-containing protein [Chitinophagaceae bacterium]